MLDLLDRAGLQPQLNNAVAGGRQSDPTRG